MTATPEEQYILQNWEEKFLNGDHSQDELCVDFFRKEVRDEDETPLLFQCVSNIKALNFLDANGVNLLQRSIDGNTLLMEKTPDFETDAYRWLVEKFKERKAVDLADDEGITPLSSMIKFGHIHKARILLENGASVDSHAEIKRYGGAKLDIPTQAINCIAPGKSDQQTVAISALALLQDFGWKATPEQKQDLLDRTISQKPKVHAWIKSNL
ncbi:ankyrin repeat domain-containing protein [Rhizobium sp. 9T]|jgi:ankyrin repeat protein|uniref:ankyrin repeat domain-containing protein n=1 Tax=Rhizobium TaxID=379 RepID=UPI001C9361A8|nr:MULTISPECIES: ankyrin repeat domain-containing protein [Rhizobium]MBY4607774.1 ankyrin repeat domain-containing protein [Rhizobium croatiense]ULR42947.1 ankyrin repeat domain-containing protein [Rhizobium sp. K102]